MINKEKGQKSKYDWKNNNNNSDCGTGGFNAMLPFAPFVEHISEFPEENNLWMSSWKILHRLYLQLCLCTCQIPAYQRKPRGTEWTQTASTSVICSSTQISADNEAEIKGNWNSVYAQEYIYSYFPVYFC